MNPHVIREWAYLIGAIALTVVVTLAVRGCTGDDPEIEQIRGERDAALARAAQDSTAAAASAEQARIWQATADEWANTVHDLLASREEARVREIQAQAGRDRLASILPDLRRQLDATREATREAQARGDARDSLPVAREALAACYDTLSACDALRVQQDRLLVAKDSVIARGDRAIVALQSRAAALDSTATHYESAYTGLLSGYAEQGRALTLYGEETAILSRRVTIRTRQRDALAIGAGAALIYALLK